MASHSSQALTPSLIGKTEGTISREQSVIETPLCFDPEYKPSLVQEKQP